MARPIKQGLDYFPFDVDFFTDEKIEAVAGEFGIKGEITAIKLLCAVYRNGYFIVWNELMKMKLLNSLPTISPELCDQIINRLVKWGFFNESLFLSDKVLTSVGIQRRFMEASKRRKTVEDLPYLLVNVCSNEVNADINYSSSSITADINTTKESKVKKRKEYPVTPLPVDVPIAVAPAACDKPLAKQKEKTWRNDYETYRSLVRSAYRALLADTALLDRQQTYYPCVDLPKSLEKACVNFWATPAGWAHKKKTKSADIDLKMTLINAISKNKVYQNEANTETKRYDNGEFLR